MAGLSNFSQEERKLIISVPYRVGVWISHADNNARTNMDNKRERQALEVAITRMARRHRKMPFAAMVMSHLRTGRNLWPEWSQQSGENIILPDLQKAIDLCRDKLSAAEVNQYKQTVWHIGLVVAQAYGEQVDPDNEMHVDRFFSWMGGFFGPPKLQKIPENMSLAEKTALKKLRAILKE